MLTALALATMSMTGMPMVKAPVPSSLPGHFEFYEIFMNPPGGSDDLQGREYITIYGPANTSLNTYAVVATENEHSGGGAEDRGTVDLIIPLDGFSTDANGMCTIRDYNGTWHSTSTTLGSFTPSDPLIGTSSEFAWEMQDPITSAASCGYTYANTGTHALQANAPVTMTIGGNTLENSGSNFFLVTKINKNLVQEVDNASGTKLNNGTNLDTDLDGVLDYAQSVKPGSWVRPWDTCVDAVFVGVKNVAKGTGAGQQIDYVSNLVSGGFATTGVTCDVFTNGTPDWFARLTDSNAFVCDVLSASGFFADDTGSPKECHFSNESSLGLAQPNSTGTLGGIQIKIGNASGYFSIKTDVAHGSVVYTH